MTGMLSCQLMILSWLLDSEEREGDAVLKGERNRSERVAWGTGRVVVRANLSAIQGLLDEGWPLTTVYQRVKNSLAGLSYRQFTDHVRRHCASTSKQPSKKLEAAKQCPESVETADHASKHESRKRELQTNPLFRGYVPGPKVPDLNELF